MSKKTIKGFTLIELLVVIAIIGLLSSIVLASLSEARQKAKNAAIIQSATQLRNAVELYISDFEEVPSVCEGMDEFGGCTSGGGVYKTGIHNNWVDYYWSGNGTGSTDISGLGSFLVSNGYLSSLPEADQVCVDESCNYEIGYVPYPNDQIERYCGGDSGCGGGETLYCGGKEWDNYLIYIYWNGEELNLPTLLSGFGTDYITEYVGSPSNTNGGQTYCIAG